MFARDGTLFVTMGDRNIARDKVQDLGTDIGKIVRIDRDGKVPADNPFLKTSGARPELWSTGHRNVQGAALHPATGELWTNEHGPKGGDELNRTLGGRNYGWPLVTYGREYSGAKITDRTEAPGLESPVHHWVPSIATSGLLFYTGERIPQWRGNVFVGGLVSQGTGASRNGRQSRRARREIVWRHVAAADPRRRAGPRWRALPVDGRGGGQPASGRTGELIQPTGARFSDQLGSSFDESRGEGVNATSVARTRLGSRGLEDVVVIFRKQPAMGGGHHFGSRPVLTPAQATSTYRAN